MREEPPVSPESSRKCEFIGLKLNSKQPRNQSKRVACQSERQACQSERLACQSKRVTCQSKRVACQSERVACQSKRVACQSERVACQSERLACESERVGMPVGMTATSVVTTAVPVRRLNRYSEGDAARRGRGREDPVRCPAGGKRVAHLRACDETDSPKSVILSERSESKDPYRVWHRVDRATAQSGN